MGLKPGEVVEVRGQRYKIVATNYEGKLILHPFVEKQKESDADMMLRLQSTTAKPTGVRVEVKKQE